MQDSSLQECHTTPFIGLTALADTQRRLRFEIAVQAGNLSSTYVNRLISADDSRFLHMLRWEVCTIMRCVRIDVIQCLIELRNGLPAVRGDHLIDDLADFLRHGPKLLGEEGFPLTLLLPDDQLKDKDPGLYHRSVSLYDYVVDRANGGVKYDREIVYPRMARKQPRARDV